MSGVSYFPQIFDQPSEGAARYIILTPEAGMTPDERWVAETDFLEPWLAYLPKGLLIDYGTGIGRLSRALAWRCSGTILGVDISSEMRRMAERYVDRPHGFATCSPQVFGRLASHGMRADGAIAVWALQHIPDIDSALIDLSGCLRTGAPFLVVNRWHRAIPVIDANQQIGWIDDKVDVHAKILESSFVLEKEEPMPATLCAPGAHVRLYRKTA